MGGLQTVIESGQIVIIMLAVVVVEVMALSIWWRFRQRGIPPLPLILNVGAGGSLMVALYLALSEAHWHLLTMALLCALAFHCADLWQRWGAGPAAATRS
jgi:hypothetical protein